MRRAVVARRDGEVLTLTLGYLLGDIRARATAGSIQQQLGAAGIQVNLVAQIAVDLLAPPTATSVPDLVLNSSPRTASDRSAAVTALGCADAFISATPSSTSSIRPMPIAT